MNRTGDPSAPSTHCDSAPVHHLALQKTRTITRRYRQTPGSVAVLCLTATAARQILVRPYRARKPRHKDTLRHDDPPDYHRRPPSLYYKWRLRRESSGCTHVITGWGFEGKTCSKGRATWSLFTRGMDAKAAGCGHTSVKTEQPINHHCSGAVGGCLGPRSISGSSSFPSAAGCCYNRSEQPEGVRAETTEAQSGHCGCKCFCFFSGSLFLRP